MLQVWKNIRYINNDFTNKNRSSWLSEISCSVVKDRVHGHACVSADEGGLASTVFPGEQRREHVFSICFPVRESSHNGKTRNATSTMASQLKNTVRGSVGPGREPSVCTPCAVWGRRSTPAHTPHSEHRVAAHGKHIMKKDNSAQLLHWLTPSGPLL